MPAKRPPVPLSRERIIESALHIADGQGLRRLTMRRLGDALQVEAMAIYHHLPRGKEALMDALAEHVTAVHVDPRGPGRPGDWRDIARTWCRATRSRLRAHPGVLALALTKPPKGRTLLTIREQTEQLAEAGLPAAADAVRALRAYVFGSVAVEIQRSGWAEPAERPADAAFAPYDGGGDGPEPGTGGDLGSGIASGPAGGPESRRTGWPEGDIDAEADFERGLDALLTGLAAARGVS